MDRQLAKLVDLLDSTPAETVNTSIRLPVNLRDAAAVATAMGLANSTTNLAVQGLRDTLDAFVQRSVLDEHYRQNPLAKPDLVEVALAAAELDGNPIAEQPRLVKRAAAEVVTLKPDANADDVLMYAAGLAAAA